MRPDDLAIRHAAFAAVASMAGSGGVVTSAQLDQGFSYGGSRHALWNKMRGIWRPEVLGPTGPARSVTTAPPRPGRAPPYDDVIAADTGCFEYRYQGTNPDASTNKAVRRAAEVGAPIIYFYGLVPGVYEALFPGYVVGDSPQRLTFYLEADVASRVEAIPLLRDVADGLARREYATRVSKQRLHQHKFRHLVLRAYRTQCAVCRLRHQVLLDAAHIIPDRDERGHPVVSNGISLCRIHHAAYDENLLGIDPDYVVRIRTDILREKDGPMLRQGLQQMNATRLALPRRVADRPDRDLLAERFRAFQAA